MAAADASVHGSDMPLLRLGVHTCVVFSGIALFDDIYPAYGDCCEDDKAIASGNIA